VCEFAENFGIREDRRTPVHIASGLDKLSQDDVEKIFLDMGVNDYKIVHHMSGKKHPHIILAALRKISIMKNIENIVKIAEESGQPIVRILNVGSGFSQRMKRILQDRVADSAIMWSLTDIDHHTIDGHMDPYNVHKYRMMDKKYLESSREGMLSYRFALSTLQEFQSEVEYDFIVFNHSIYYFSPEEISVAMSEHCTDDAIGFGVYHQFKTPTGSFSHIKKMKDRTIRFDEATWCTKEGMIHMLTKGNTTPYCHPPPVWVARGGAQVGDHSIVCHSEEIGTGSNTYMLTLHRVQGVLQQGRVFNTGVAIPDTPYHIPTRILDEIMRLALQKNDLTGKNEDSLRRIISVRLKKDPDSQHLGPYLDRILQLVLERCSESRAQHTAFEWLKKPFLLPFLEEKRGVLAVLSYFFGPIAVPFVCIFKRVPVCFRYLCLVLCLLAKFCVLLVGFLLCPKCTLAILMAIIAPVLFCFCCCFGTVASAMVHLPEWYEGVIADGATYGATVDVGYLADNVDDFVLRGLNTVVDPDNYPMCPSAYINVTEEDPGDVCESAGLTAIGPIWADSVPRCFAQTTHNQYVSARTRACVSPPTFDGDDGEHLPGCDCDRCRMWDLYEETQKKYIDPEIGVIDPMSFDEWNDGFPGAKAKINRTVYDRVMKAGAHAGDFFYKVFVKREANVPGFTYESFEKLRPRMISGITKVWKVVTGPFMKTLSKVTAAAFDAASSAWYVSGATAEHINQWANLNLTTMVDPVFYWLDFSKYDTTQKFRSICAEIRFCERVGVCESVEYWAHVVRAKLFKRAYGKNLKYGVSATRGSGENATSILNSILNMTIFYMVVDAYAGIKDVTVEYVLENVKCALMGDDFIAMIDAAYIDIKTWQAIENNITRRLGFVIEDGLSRNPIDADFLNMAFYPTEDGVRVGKKPGRNIAKAGVIVDKRKGFNVEERVSILNSNMNSALPTANHVPFLRVFVREILHHISISYENVPVTKRYDKFIRSQWMGDVHEADQQTWTAFEEKYGLTATDEAAFGAYLRDALTTHGLFCILQHYTLPLLW
jgi:hypothetical protein